MVLDTYPDTTWEALVESVSPATGAEFAILPPQNASGNWVKVVQRLPVKLRLLAHVGEPPLRAGMTATVSDRHRPAKEPADGRPVRPERAADEGRERVAALRTAASSRSSCSEGAGCTQSNEDRNSSCTQPQATE